MKLVKIIAGEHAGTIAHVTGRIPQYGGANVTPIYGDPLVSILVRRHQIEPIEGHWVCSKCRAKGIQSHIHNGCDQGATFAIEETLI